MPGQLLLDCIYTTCMGLHPRFPITSCKLPLHGPRCPFLTSDVVNDTLTSFCEFKSQKLGLRGLSSFPPLSFWDGSVNMSLLFWNVAYQGVLVRDYLAKPSKKSCRSISLSEIKILYLGQDICLQNICILKLREQIVAPLITKKLAPTWLSLSNYTEKQLVTSP